MLTHSTSTRDDVQGHLVVHLLAELHPSGMERMLCSMMPTLSRAGWDSLVIGQGSNHSFVSELVSSGHSVNTIEAVKTRRGLSQWGRVLRDARPSAIHIHTESAYGATAAVARLACPQAQIVRTIHSIFTPTGPRGLSRRMQATLGDRLVNRLVACSPDVATNEAGYGRHPGVILNWVGHEFLVADLDEVDREEDLAVIVGNCSSIKRHELALEAAWTNGLRLAHHGDESKASRKESELLDMFDRAGRLVHRGTASPVESLARASIFLMPSSREGMPVALAEALSMRVPAVVSDSPGLRWASRLQGVTAVGASSEEWIHATRATGIDELRRGRGERPPDFSPERGTNEYLDLYRGGPK